MTDRREFAVATPADTLEIARRRARARARRDGLRDLHPEDAAQLRELERYAAEYTPPGRRTPHD